MLWELTCYDGPLSGIASYKGRLVYFTVESEGGWEFISNEEYNKLPTDEKVLAEKREQDGNIVYFHDMPRTYRLYDLSAEAAKEMSLRQETAHKYGYKHYDHRPEFSAPPSGNKVRIDKYFTWLQTRPNSDLTAGRPLGVWKWEDFKQKERPYLIKS